MTRRILLLFAVFVLLFQNNLNARNTFEIADTLIPRGQIYKIPLIGQIDAVDFQSITLEFEFDANIIDIKQQAIIEEGNLLQDQTLSININLSDLENATASITSMNANAGNGIFCYIEVEGLVGPDSITQIIPTSFKINGQDVEEAELTQGTIKVPGLPIIPGFIDEIKQNWPNPFWGATIFEFSVAEETSIEFVIYDISGKLSGSIPSDLTSIYYRIYDNTGEYNLDDGEKLPKGNYYLQLVPLQGEFSAGLYYIFMKTSRGVYNKNFIYNK